MDIEKKEVVVAEGKLQRREKAKELID